MISPAPLLVSALFHAFSSYAILTSSKSSQQHQLQHHDFSVAHSYPEGTSFDKKDGWKRVFVSDLAYKYRNTTIADHHHAHNGHRLGKEHGHGHSKQSRIQKRQESDAADLVPLKGGLLGAALKGIGKVTTVIITWYTGNDLKNPSCWPAGHWTPTDDAFVCALTLEGWTSRPKCFAFLELCHGSSKCVFVRVVDTCAGCKPGSHHVDLTRGAFTRLADLDVGTLSVDMRIATLPTTVWQKNLWGPK